MAKVKSIGSNQTEVHKDDGTVVLVSYETPVACFISGEGYYKTSEHYSKTTSRHINQWLPSHYGKDAKTKTPEELSRLL
jgi:hypothetical protein